MFPLRNSGGGEACDFVRGERGAVLVELAFALPVLVLLFGGVVEMGRAYYCANAIERGLRAGALYAARAPFPLSASDQAITQNLVETGTMDGSGSPLVAGWSDTGASLKIDTSQVFTAGDEQIPVIKLTATVPFDPIFPSLLTWLGLGPTTIVLKHEQAWIGD